MSNLSAEVESSCVLLLLLLNFYELKLDYWAIFDFLYVIHKK